VAKVGWSDAIFGSGIALGLRLFNHQTHHRGHACCSILTGAGPPSLDLFLSQRGVPAQELAV